MSLPTPKSLLFASLVAMGTLLAAPAFAVVPVSITQQGKLLNDEGTPLTGNQTLQFEIYDASSGGAMLWSDQISVDLGDTGVYTAVLGGESNPIDATLLQDGEAYLELTVGSDTLSPRLPMTSVPFAALAQRAAVADAVADGSITSAAFAPGAVTSDAVDSIAWDQITGVPSSVTDSSDTLADLGCTNGEVAVAHDGGWTCGTQPSYSGSDFALANQSCSGSQVAVGISASGSLICDSPTTYTGSDFALSNQTCSGSQVAVGISATGSLICDEQASGGTYTAGAGLTLSGNEFSVTPNNYLPCSGTTCPRGEASRLYYDANTSGNYWIGRAGNNLATGTRLDINGDLRVADRLSVNQGVGETPSFGQMVYIKQESFTNGLVFESPVWNDVTHFWNIHSFDDFGDSGGHFQFRHRTDGGSFQVRAQIDPDDGSYNQVSDANLKEDIHYLDNVLDDVLQLRPTQYRMVHQDEDSDPKIGFLAQEVQRIFPQLVQYSERESLFTIGYAGFSVLAIQAIREQQAIIDSQDLEIHALQIQVDELEDRLRRLEERLAP